MLSWHVSSLCKVRNFLKWDFYLFICLFYFFLQKWITCFRAMYASESVEKLNNSAMLRSWNGEPSVQKWSESIMCCIFELSPFYLLLLVMCENSENHKRAGFTQVYCFLLNPSSSWVVFINHFHTWHCQLTSPFRVREQTSAGLSRN